MNIAKTDELYNGLKRYLQVKKFKQYSIIKMVFEDDCLHTVIEVENKRDKNFSKKILTLKWDDIFGIAVYDNDTSKREQSEMDFIRYGEMKDCTMDESTKLPLLKGLERYIAMGLQCEHPVISVLAPVSDEILRVCILCAEYYLPIEKVLQNKKEMIERGLAYEIWLDLCIRNGEFHMRYSDRDESPYNYAEECGWTDADVNYIKKGIAPTEKLYYTGFEYLKENSETEIEFLNHLD